MSKEKQIDISVIVPFYNVADYIEECLNSLINQTFDNYEIILINDGSMDKSEEIVKKYLDNEKIRYYREENKGLSGARNHGIELSKGKYLCFVDSDDYVDRCFLERLFSNIDEEDIVKCLAVKVDNDRRILSKQSLKYIETASNNNYSFLQDYSAWSKLFKASFIKDNNIRFSVGEEYEDTCFSLVTNSICNNYKVVEHYGYYYRQRPLSITTDRKKTCNPNIPYVGFEESVSAIVFNNKIKDKELVEFEIIKSLTSFLTETFYLCNKKKRKELSIYSVSLIEKYIPNFAENKYIKHMSVNIHMYQKTAIKIFVISYKLNLVYLYSLLVSTCLKCLNRLGLYK